MNQLEMVVGVETVDQLELKRTGNLLGVGEV